MNPRTLRSEALLLLASIIWGFAFVAQRAAMEHLGPFLFNAVRFGIGTLTLLPFLLLGVGNAPPASARRDVSWSGGALAGGFLFGGASLQQAGMVTTTAGKAGFITALYVVLVPLFGLFVRHRPSVGAWIGVAFAVIGLYFLCVQESLHIVRGDALALGATLFWALHILLVGSLTSRIRMMTFACVQCAVCAILCGAVAMTTETISLAAMRQTIAPLLYAGILSTGVAFTLQIVGQRGTPPAHAAILLALESVFAVIGGTLLLGESMTARQILGCILMLAGVMISQLGSLARSGIAGNLARWALVVLTLTACGCGRNPPEPGLIWRTGTMAGSRAGGDVLVDGHETWIAYEDDSTPNASQIRIVQVNPRRRKAPSRVLAVVEGAAPSLARDARGGFVLVHALRMADGTAHVVQRHAAADGHTWSAPTPLGAPGARIANDRLAVGADGAWLVPAVRDSGAGARIVFFQSRDSGATWDERRVGALADAADPAVAACGGKLLLVARCAGALVQCTSSDAGATWSAFAPLAVASQVEPTPHCLVSDGMHAWLAWTDTAPDTGIALPQVRALRRSETSDGRNWSRGAPIVWRAGSIPCAPALAMNGRLATVLFSDRGENAGEIVCLAREAAEIEHPIRPAAIALRLWAQHTLARPMMSQRLFIEGYFMRGLIAAHAALPWAPVADAPLDTPAGLQRAAGFAEWMMKGQTELGYWPLGYRAVYVADMAAVIALYAELGPYTGPERMSRYVASAEKFAAALERDGMLLSSGAVGIGWPETRTPSESTAVRTPYLVSTSLAGISVHAWLFSRTKNPVYRERALRSLDFTLAQIQPDGSLAGLELGETKEGPFLVAAYVEEGWMASDTYLDDKAVHDRLRRALPPHVDWLVRSQRPDGTWDSGADGEFARTTPIVNFLLWYDKRCASHPGARAAVERAAVPLTDPDRWMANGILRAGKHEEVLRALSSRPLAAIARGS